MYHSATGEQQVVLFPRVSVLGVFRQQFGVRSRDGGSVMAERGREEVVEKTLFPAEGIRHLLRPQGQGQGVYHEKKQKKYSYLSISIL